jgi:asparagine synthase (glutamine-hydrolysing)
MHDTLSYDVVHRRGIFDPHTVQALIRANQQGSVDGAYPLLTLMCTELWCRAFVDGVVPS